MLPPTLMKYLPDILTFSLGTLLCAERSDSDDEPPSSAAPPAHYGLFTSASSMLYPHFEQSPKYVIYTHCDQNVPLLCYFIKQNTTMSCLCINMFKNTFTNRPS